MGLLNVYNTLENKHTVIKANGRLHNILPEIDFKHSLVLKAGNRLDGNYEVQPDDVLFVREVPSATAVAVVATVVLERFGKKLDDVVYENHDMELSGTWAPLLNVRRTDIIKAGSLIEIHIKGTLHIAVALDDRTMIHATTNQGVRISKIAAYKLAAVYEVL